MNPSSSSASSLSSTIKHHLILGLASLIYLIFSCQQISLAYINFQDGKALYLSRRLADGLTLYQDALCNQPPLHFFLGSILIRLGSWFDKELLVIRLFSIFLHLFTAYLVSQIARKIFKSENLAILAGIFYLFLPIGFWWSRGYQGELLTCFFLTAAFLALLYPYPSALIISSLFSWLSLFTSITAVPFVLLFAVYIVTHFRKKYQYYIFPLLALTIISLAIMHWYSEGAYWHNVWFYYLRFYPLISFLQKIVNQFSDVKYYEGGFVLLAALGVMIYLVKATTKEKFIVSWYVVFSFASVFFISKSTSVAYIFCLAEPMVACFAAYFIFNFWFGSAQFSKLSGKYALLSERVIRMLVFLVVFGVLVFPMVILFWETAGEINFENNSTRVKAVMQIIEAYSKPGDMILASPYYAFITGRKLPAECSAMNIIYLDYMKDKEQRPNRKVDTIIDEICAYINGENVKIVFLDNNLFGQIEPIKKAVLDNYTKIDELKSINEDIGIYVPNWLSNF